MSKAPSISNLVHDTPSSPPCKSSTQSTFSAPFHTPVRMSAHDSSESPTDPQDHDADQAQEHEDGDGDGHEPPAKRQKRSRACQACRAMKIRCLPVEGQEACRACGKVNRACVMPGPPRKRQKTVHKVAELEKKINALTASLAAKTNTVTSPTPPTTDSPAATTSTTSAKFVPPAPRPDKEYSYETVMNTHYPNPSELNSARPPLSDLPLETVNDEYEDVITRGILDIQTVENMYQHWRTKMCPCSPGVAFSEHVTVDWLRRKRPITLLAILVAAGGIITPDVQPDIAVELARILADRVMFVNEKSLDLVQAMLVYSTWYGKHKFAKDLGFNHYIHSAVAMCLDLGLGKRSRQQNHTDAQDAELRRTWLACYFMAGNVATVLRLPPLVKYSPYIEECLESFVKHPGSLPTDAYLCCLAKFTRMMEDVGVLFHMDDPGSTIPINDSRTQYSLKGFEHQLKEWKEATRPHLPEAVLNHYEATASLYIHEIALHNEHNVDDFRPMYRSTGRETQDVHAKDFLTHAHFDALAACVDAMERSMQSFAEIDHLFLRNASSMHVVWTAYVSVAMIRLYGILAVPNSKYGSIFLPKLDVTKSLDQCIQKLEMVTGDNVQVPAESFILAFKKLRVWHVHRTQQFNNSKSASTDPNAAKTMPHDMYCAAAAELDTLDSKVQSGSQPRQLQTQRPVHHYPRVGQPYGQALMVEQQQIPLTPLAPNSTLLDPNTAIDASTFDIQNWDFSVGELNNFENYLNDPGWMGYLM